MKNLNLYRPCPVEAKKKIFLHKRLDVFMFSLLNPVKKMRCPFEADWIAFS